MNTGRTAHPYHLFDAIFSQPAAFERVLGERSGWVKGLASAVESCRMVYLVGVGTSHHAAMAGGHLFRALAPHIHVAPWHAFDFAEYGPTIRPDEVAIILSHRGNKRFAEAALRRAAASGATTAIITGRDSRADRSLAGTMIETVAQEQSSAHSVSYVGALAALTALAAAVGHREIDAGALSAAMRECLRLDGWSREAAARYSSSRRIWLAGAGPGEVTAREIALKIQESSYLGAEGRSVEAMLHGPFQCAEPNDLFVLIAPEGPGRDRMHELAGQARRIGAATLVVANRSEVAHWSACDSACAVPDAPEPLTLLTYLIPLQLFAYHLALERGTNPDSFRLDDPRYAEAASMTIL